MYTVQKPFVVVIFGTAGVGKSTIAEFLKNQITNTAHVSSDHIKRYISEFKQVPSHNEVSRTVTNAMIVEYLKNGISVVLDQGMSKEQIEVVRDIANEYHATFLVYRIEADPDIRLARINERALRVGQPAMSQETMDVLLNIYKDNTYPATATFDSGVLSTEEICNRILEDIKD